MSKFAAEKRRKTSCNGKWLSSSKTKLRSFALPENKMKPSCSSHVQKRIIINTALTNPHSDEAQKGAKSTEWIKYCFQGPDKSAKAMSHSEGVDVHRPRHHHHHHQQPPPLWFMDVKNLFPGSGPIIQEFLITASMMHQTDGKHLHRKRHSAGQTPNLRAAFVCLWLWGWANAFYTLL